jgi:hypothetical protein
MHGYRRFRASAEKKEKNARVEIERAIEVQFREKSSNLKRLIVNLHYVAMAKIAQFWCNFLLAASREPPRRHAARVAEGAALAL